MRIMQFVVYATIMTYLTPLLAFSWTIVPYKPPESQLIYHHQPLAIPSNLGHIQNVYQSSTSQNTVVLLKDLHCDYEVQKNIAKILQILRQQHGLSLVGLEGAWLPIDVSGLAGFNLDWARDAIADYLVRRGRYTGAEYEAVTGSPGLHLVGVEDRNVYLTCLDQVRHLLSSEAQGYFFDLKQNLEDLKPGLYNRGLTKLDNLVQSYRKGKLPLRQYARMLIQSAQRHGTAPEQQAQLRQLLHQDQGKKQGAVNQAMQTSLQAMEHSLRQQLYSDPSQQQLDELLGRLDLIEKMLNISATPDEMAGVRKHPENFKTQVFLDFMERWSTSGKILLDPDVVGLDDYVQEALRFYQEVDGRSRFFVRHLLQQMETGHADLAVLVCGGYHSREVMKLLKQKDVSFISIEPCHQPGNKNNPYFKNLIGQKTALEKLLLPTRSGFALPIQSPQVKEYGAFPDFGKQLPGVDLTQEEIAELKILSGKIARLTPGHDEEDVKWSPDRRSVAVKTGKLACILTSTGDAPSSFAGAGHLRLGQWTATIGHANAFEKMAEWVGKRRTPVLAVPKVMFQMQALARGLLGLPLFLTRMANRWLNEHYYQEPQFAWAGGTGAVTFSAEAGAGAKLEGKGPYHMDAASSRSGGEREATGTVKSDLIAQLNRSIVSRRSRSNSPDGSLPGVVVDADISQIPDPGMLTGHAQELAFLGSLVRRSMGFAGPGPADINRFRFLTMARRWSRWFFRNIKDAAYLIIASDARKNPDGSLIPGTFFSGDNEIREVLFFYGEGAHARSALGQVLALAITPPSSKRIFTALPDDMRMFKIIASSTLGPINWKGLLAAYQNGGGVDANGLATGICKIFKQKGITNPKIVMLYREHHQELMQAFAGKMGITLDKEKIEREINQHGEVLLTGTSGRLLLKLNDDVTAAFNFNTGNEEEPHLIIGAGGVSQGLFSALAALKMGNGKPAYNMAAMLVPGNDREIELMKQYQIKPGQIFGVNDLVTREEAKESLCVFGVYQNTSLGGRTLKGPEVVANRTAITLAEVTSQGVRPLTLFYQAPEPVNPATSIDKVVAYIMSLINLKEWDKARDVIRGHIKPLQQPLFQNYLEGYRILGQEDKDETQAAKEALGCFEAGLTQIQEPASGILPDHLRNMKAGLEKEVLALSQVLKQKYLASGNLPEALLYSEKAVAMSSNNGSFEIWSDHIRLVLDTWVKTYEAHVAAFPKGNEKDKLKFLLNLFHEHQKTIQETLFDKKLGDGSPLSAWQFLLYATLFDDFPLSEQAKIMDQWRDEIDKDPENYDQWTLELIERAQKRRQRTSQTAGMEENQGGKGYIKMRPWDVRQALTDQALSPEEGITGNLINQIYFSETWSIIGAQARILIGLGLKEPAKIYFDRWQKTMEEGMDIAFKGQAGPSNFDFLIDLANLYYEKYLAFGDEAEGAREKAKAIYLAYGSEESFLNYVFSHYPDHKDDENAIISYRRLYEMRATSPLELNPFLYCRPSTWKKRRENLEGTSADALDPGFEMDSLPEFKALKQRLPQRADLIQHGITALSNFVAGNWQYFSEEPDYQTQLQMLHQSWQNATYVEQQALAWAMRFNDIGLYLDPEAYAREERSAGVAKDILNRLHVLPEIRDLTLRLIKIQSLLGQVRRGELRYAALHRALDSSRVKFGLVQMMHAMETVARAGKGNALSLAELNNIIHFNNQTPAAGPALADYRLESFGSNEWTFNPEQPMNPRSNPLISGEFGKEMDALLIQLGNGLDMLDGVRDLAVELNASRPDLYPRLMKLLIQLSLAVKPGVNGKAMVIHSDYGHLPQTGNERQQILRELIQWLDERDAGLSTSQVADELKQNHNRSVWGLPVYISGHDIWLRFGKLNKTGVEDLARQRLMADKEVETIASQMSPSRSKRMGLAWAYFSAIQEQRWDVLPQRLSKLVQRLFGPWFTSASVQEQTAFLWAVALHDVLPDEEAAAEWADKYLKEQKVSEAVRERAVNLIRYHSYPGQARLGERRESLLLSEAIFKSHLPFWMLQALNALDVIAQKWTIAIPEMAEQLGEIMAYPKNAQTMAQHYDQYRLETMAKPRIAAPRLENGQVEQLNQTVSKIFGKQEPAYRAILKDKVDLLDHIAHLSHALVASHQGDYTSYVKWIRFLVQLAQAAKHDNVVIRTDISDLEVSGRSLARAVSQAAKKLDGLVAAFPDRSPSARMKTIIRTGQGECCGIPITVSKDGVITLQFSRLVKPGSSKPQKSSSVLSNHYAIVGLSFMVGMHMMDMGLCPHVIAGLGLALTSVRLLWDSGLFKPAQKWEPKQPRRRYRFRRTWGADA